MSLLITPKRGFSGPMATNSETNITREHNRVKIPTGRTQTCWLYIKRRQEPNPGSPIANQEGGLDFPPLPPALIARPTPSTTRPCWLLLLLDSDLPNVLSAQKRPEANHEFIQRLQLRQSEIFQKKNSRILIC